MKIELNNEDIAREVAKDILAAQADAQGGEDRAAMSALVASQNLLKTIYRLNTHGSIGEYDWEDKGIGDLIKKQIDQNRAVLTPDRKAQT